MIINCGDWIYCHPICKQSTLRSIHTSLLTLLSLVAFIVFFSDYNLQPPPIVKYYYFNCAVLNSLHSLLSTRQLVLE